MTLLATRVNDLHTMLDMRLRLAGLLNPLAIITEGAASLNRLVPAMLKCQNCITTNCRAYASRASA